MFLFGIVVSCTLGSSKVIADETVILTGNGLIRGYKKTSQANRFLGIPYAEPPIGNLRWKPPVPINKWNAIYDAQKFRDRCEQPFSSAQPMSEDCLYLNVWSPADPSENALPVMIWIHGGGFYGGSGSDQVNRGDILAQKGAVVITINYRLGIFGFFSHPGLSAESRDHISGNYGLMDQLEAIKWVKNNIQFFGGDPNNITILGESAGGTSVATLMTLPQARGLFQRAVLESGYASSFRPLQSVGNDVTAESIGTSIAHRLGCDGVSATDCLRSASKERLLEESNFNGPVTTQLGPTVDGVFIPESPDQSFAMGHALSIPTIISVMKNEAIRNPALKKVRTVAQYRNFLKRCFPAQSEKVFGAFPAFRDIEVFPQIEQLFTDIGAASYATKLLSDLSCSQSQCYLFQFSRVPPFSKRNGWGAFHGLDVDYVFQTNMRKPEYSKKDFDISDRLQRLLVGFADVGTANIPLWSSQESYTEIGREFRTRHRLEKNRLRLLDSTTRGDCTIY